MQHLLGSLIGWVPIEGHQKKDEGNKCSDRERKNNSMKSGER